MSFKSELCHDFSIYNSGFKRQMDELGLTLKDKGFVAKIYIHQTLLADVNCLGSDTITMVQDHPQLEEILNSRKADYEAAGDSRHVVFHKNSKATIN